MKKCIFCEYTVIKGYKQVCKKCKAVYHGECWNILGRCINQGCLCADSYQFKLTAPFKQREAEEDKTPLMETEYKTRVMDTKTHIAPPSKKIKSSIKLNWKRLAIIGVVPLVLLFLFLVLFFLINTFTGNNVEKLYHSGLKKMEEEKYQMALETFEKAYGIDPSYPDLKVKLAETYLKLVKTYKDELKYNDAIETLNKAADLVGQEKIKKELIEIYNTWGENLLKQGSFQSALEKFEKVLEIDKGNEEAKKQSIHTLVSMIYSPEFEVTEEQLKLILSDKDCRTKLEKDGIKLYSVDCKFLKVDINRDGSKDIIVAGEDKDSSLAGVDVYKVNAGKPVLLTSVDTSGYFLNKICALDVNGDKFFEVFSDWTEPGSTKLGFTVMIFYKDDKISKRDTTKISDCPVVLEDINKDGTMEITGKKLYEGVFIDDGEVFLPCIYETQNYEFVDVTGTYAEDYRKLYIKPFEDKLQNMPAIEDPLEKVKYEEKLRGIIQKLYEMADMKYSTGSGGKTPDETMKANFDYINQQEFYMLRSSERRSASSFEDFYNLWRYNMSVKVNELTLVSQEEDKAEVTVVFEATDYVKPGETRTETYRGTYYLIKEGDLWYLQDSKVK